MGSVSHSYAAAGEHTVSISGGLKRIILNDGASALKLRSIDQWGDTQWTSMGKRLLLEHTTWCTGLPMCRTCPECKA